MGNVEETTNRPALNGATRSYIVTAGVCFTIVALLLLGFAQEEAAKKQKESLLAIASGAAADGKPSLSPEQAERGKKVKELAQQSQGKFDSLDNADQEFLNGLSSGHGREMLQAQWDALKKQGATAPEADPETMVRQVIERTRGDYSKVTAEERGHLETFTSGHGKQYFEVRAKQWKESLQGKDNKAASQRSSPAVTNK